MQRNHERNNQLEIDRAIIKFVVIVCIIDVIFFSIFKVIDLTGVSVP